MKRLEERGLRSFPLKTMTDANEKKEPKEPISGVLDRLLSSIENRKQTSKSGSTSLSIVGGLILAVLVFVALAFAAWQAWKKGVEVAKLKHKIDVDKEDKVQTLLREQIDSNNDERSRFKKEALALDVSIKANEDKVKKLEEDRVAIHKRIDEITSWEDLDREK